MGSALRAARGRARSRHRGRGRLRRARPPARRRRRARRSPKRRPRSGRSRSSAQGGDRDPAADYRRPGADRSSGTAQLKLYSRPGETSEAFAARADAEAQTQADSEAAKIRDRLEAKRDRLEASLETARRRADELDDRREDAHTTELLAGAGTILNVLLGGRGSARDNRPRRTRDRQRRLAPRDDGPHRRAETNGRGEGEAKTEQTLEELEQEIVDEVARDRRGVDGEGGRRSKRSRSARVRLTCASSSRSSSGCPPPEGAPSRSRSPQSFCSRPSADGAARHPSSSTGPRGRVARRHGRRHAPARRRSARSGSSRSTRRSATSSASATPRRMRSSCSRRSARRSCWSAIPRSTTGIATAGCFGTSAPAAGTSISSSSGSERPRPTSTAASAAEARRRAAPRREAALAERRGAWRACPAARLAPTRQIAAGPP